MRKQSAWDYTPEEIEGMFSSGCKNSLHAKTEECAEILGWILTEKMTWLKNKRDNLIHKDS